MRPALLANVPYGNEITDRIATLEWPRAMFQSLPPEIFDRVYDTVFSFFTQLREGVFGGQITAGDGLMIALYMELVRPTHMVEFGVASGYSSAFILEYARAAGLLTEGRIFLTSFDLVAETAAGQKTGGLLDRDFPDLVPYWSLHCETTSVEVIGDPSKYGLDSLETPVLAFVDGGHNHPWPIMDLACLREIMPSGSWVLMQDWQMMERWLQDCLWYGSASPSPIRGVNLAVSLWPGEKIIGQGICYNTAAVRLSIGPHQFRDFARAALRYPFEIEFNGDLILGRG